MRTILLSILLALILGSGIGEADTSILSQSDEKSCLASVKSMVGVARETSLLEAMRRGQWECVKSIISFSESTPAIDYRSVIDKEMKAMVEKMEAIKMSVKDFTIPVQKSIHCPFKWAQSPTEILLSVKFSHKIDAPATLNVVAQNVSVTDDRLILLASDGKKSFRLEINFMNNVIPSESTWSMASVGRMNFNIKKAGEPSKWVGLTKDNKKLWQMHNWFEMQDKFEVELEKLEELAAKAAAAPAVSAVSAVESVANDAEVIDVAEGTEGVVGVDPGSVDSSISSDPEASAEELARKEEKKAQDDHKRKLSALYDESRIRKRDIDVSAKQQKAVVDSDIAGRVEELERAREAREGGEGREGREGSDGEPTGAITPSNDEL